MSVPSIAFLIFALVGALVINISSAPIWRRLVFLIMNAAMFWSFCQSPLAAAPYLAFLVSGYLSVILITRTKSAGVFAASMIVVIGEFFILKKYAFVPPSTLLTFAYTTIGLSYVFFRVLHVMIDARQGEKPAGFGPLGYVNYTMNFAALVAGPIQFYPDYRLGESEAPARLDLFAIARAAERIVIGFFKVFVVSSLLHGAQAWALAVIGRDADAMHRIVLTGAADAIYPLYLFANFSGYTDFVIGIARLFRLELPENFNAPFLSENFIAFWSRWHITLSNWLKTYVYTPLLMGLMRRFDSVAVEPFLAVFAYFVTFFLVGAWHGQTATFLFFGVLQGGGVAANKLYQIVMTAWLTRKGYRALGAQPAYLAICRGLTFTWFAFTLLWFWHSGVQLARFVAQVGLGDFAISWALVLVCATAALTMWAWLSARLWNPDDADPEALPASRYWRTVRATAMLMVIAVGLILFNGPAPDVVYKHF